MAYLTIVLPNYNYFEGYEKNLANISAQSISSQEELKVIISDDSTSSQIEDHFAVNYRKHGNYKYARGPQAGGVANWNECIRLADTRYTMILHHDEYISSEFFVDSIIEILKKNDFDLVILPLIKKSRGKLFKHYPVFLKWIYVQFPALLFSCNAFGSPSVIVYKTCIAEEYDESLRWFVDVDWYYRLLKKSSNVGLLNGNVHTIVSDLDFENTETNSMNPSKLAPVEKAYLRQKYSLSRVIYSRILKPLQFPVILYKLLR